MNKLIVLSTIFIFCLFSLGLDAQEQPLEDRPKATLSTQTLLLDQCVKFALLNSHEVKLARLDYLIKEQDRSIAEAIFDTTLSGEISYEVDEREGISVFAPQRTQTNTYSVAADKKLPSGTELTLSFEDKRESSDSTYVAQNPAHTAEVSLKARQPIAKNAFGYVDRRDISITSLAIANADLDSQERIETLIADVEIAYWQWSFAKQNLGVYQQLQNMAKQLHQTNLKNYETGLIEQGDLLASEANVLLRERDAALADNQYRRAEEKIKLLLNVKAEQRLYPQQRLEYKKLDINFEDCLKEAFQNRRDYFKAKRETEIKNLTLETKANKRWPEIDLVASLTANGIDSSFGNAVQDLTSEVNQDYYLGVEFSLPIENRQARSEFTQAEYSKEKALIELKDIERTIVTEIGDLFRDYVTYAANVRRVKQASQLQQEKLNHEEKRFLAGRSNTKTLIDYQQDYLSAQLQVYQGLRDLEQARVKLEKGLNIILDKYEGLI